jgi:hypothetical protein
VNWITYLPFTWHSFGYKTRRTTAVWERHNINIYR